MARLVGYLTCFDSDVITGTIWTFLERRGTVGIGLIVPTPELIAAVSGKSLMATAGEAWNICRT